MKFLLHIIMLSFSVVGLVTNISYSQTKIDSLESIIAQNDSLIMELTQEHEKLLEQLEIKGTTITDLKNQDELSFLQRRRLEGLLQEFQSVSNKAEQLDILLQEKQTAQIDLKQELWRAYQHAIDELLSYMTENINTMNNVQRQRYLDQVKTLRAKRIALAANLGSLPFAQTTQMLLTIKPTDDYRRIKDKADLLKDHEDQIRNNVAQIDKKIVRFKQEIELREKLTDFIDDVSLFEHHDEAIASAQKATQTLVEDALNFYNEFERTNAGGGQSGTLIDIGESLWEIDPSFLSLEEAEIIILLFEEYKTALSTQADSLAVRAKDFYERAEKIRKSPKGQA